MRKSQPAIIRVDYLPGTLTGGCSCCGKPSRMSIVDCDRDLPICEGCVRPSVDAAIALHSAGIVPPGPALIELNP